MDHIYFDTNAADDSRIQAARNALAAGADPKTLGTTLPMGHRLGWRSPSDLDHLMGAGFADALADIPTGTWAGPIASRYGQHLVLVEARQSEREVARGRGSSSLASKRPWLIAAGFGLLHGFGFAGALSELGVPEGAIPLSLAAFNVGVELGQLLFVAVILLALDLLRWWGLASGRGWRMAPAYAMGIVGGLWVLERVAAVMGIAAFA
ncbi:MAG: HupE/UreJ family protein [Proteobacteria bacterium]|nr:HupE/UreJ family protein [Pseudomonadota bacterium]